ncbi:phosphate/phosphite/phosphonate ABC transporter substrate-binding protein [Sulfurospirillum sp. 1612]|uniref:phosphate/phosphite/phosphonate ABC transporter substrate-binding protein n=1 Tax=Sulfurospirillum sp. 1612 TaxID=3094835 RepID=UPI002F91FB42
MKNDKKFSTGGKIFTTFLLLFTLFLPLDAKNITFSFTGTTLKEDLKTYLQWKTYLEQNSKFKIDIKFARTYAEVVSNIKDAKSDIAYVCSSTYTLLKDKDNADLLAIPIINGQDKYYSEIIALKGTKYKSIMDFKGKIFAFTDPDSTSGSIAPTYTIFMHGDTITNFFSNLIYTYDHGESIKAVLDGFVDGASIDSLVLTQYAKKHPKDMQNLRVVQKLGPYTISPIVARNNLNKREFQELQNLFLNMHHTKIGKEILNHLNIDRFEKPTNQTYSNIYKMLNALKEKK